MRNPLEVEKRLKSAGAPIGEELRHELLVFLQNHPHLLEEPGRFGLEGLFTDIETAAAAPEEEEAAPADSFIISPELYRKRRQSRKETKERSSKVTETVRQRVYDWIHAHNIRWKNNIPPMSFDVFAEALDGNPLRPRQREAFEKSDLLSPYGFLNPKRRIQELVLIWGKGSGKDRISAQFITWMAYVLLHMDEAPARYFGMAENTTLHIVNVAPTEDLAKQVFFTYLKQFMLSELMRPFIPNPESQILSDTIRFPSINVAIYSKHSRSTGLDGYNLLAWIMDEADAFHDGANHSNAEEVHNILRSSANTRLRNRWVGMVISYPRSKDGFLMRLKRRAENDPSFFVDVAKTWEVRPEISRDDPGIASDYQNDPVDAAAKYECIPPEVEQAFFEFPEKIDAAIDPKLAPAVECAVVEVDREMPDGRVHHFVGAEILEMRPDPAMLYFIGIDIGVQNDAFALAMFHINYIQGRFQYLCPRCLREEPELVSNKELYTEVEVAWNDNTIRCGGCMKTSLEMSRIPEPFQYLYMKTMKDGKWLKLKNDIQTRKIWYMGQEFEMPLIVEDFLLQIKPVHGTHSGQPNRPVDLIGVESLIRQICENFNVVKVRTDPWNAKALVQRLNAFLGIDAAEISFSQSAQNQRARFVKTLLYNDCIRLLPNQPQRDTEWKQLVRAPKGVEHPPTGSKDLFDAEAVAIFMAATAADGRLEAITDFTDRNTPPPSPESKPSPADYWRSLLPYGSASRNVNTS